MNRILKLFLFLSVLAVTMKVQAQTAGDKLFSQGQQLQMTQTVKSQNLAIKKFEAAKRAYDSVTKKTMCNNQIAICKNNIKTINKKVKVYTKEVYVENNNDVDSVAVIEPQEPVKLSFSMSSIEFKAGGKNKNNHQVTINCNYDDWTVSQPEWITTTKNGNILTLIAEPNETDSERSGVMVVECRGIKAELMVYQKPKFSIKSLFGGKKK